MQAKNFLGDPLQLIQRLRNIHTKVNFQLERLPSLLSTEEQVILTTVEESYGLVINNLHEVIEDCQRAVGNSQDLINYCMMAIPVIAKQITSVIVTTISRIDFSNQIKKKSTSIIFEDFWAEIDQLESEIIPHTKIAQTYYPEEDKKLQDQQALLTPLLGEPLNAMQEDFHEVLGLIKNSAIKRMSKMPEVFISYAWPTDANSHEFWVQRFLNDFCSHLLSVGIITYLDIIDSTMGRSPAQHMALIRGCSDVILIGTLSLAEKELGKGYMVQAELNYIREAIQDNGAQVIPMLLSGDYQTAFPIDFLRYTAIEAFREMGYLRGLQAIIRFLFIGRERNDSYDLLWLPFNQKYDHYFPAPKGVSASLPIHSRSPSRGFSAASATTFFAPPQPERRPVAALPPVSNPMPLFNIQGSTFEVQNFYVSAPQGAQALNATADSVIKVQHLHANIK
jgi:hypothetical protein